MTRRQGSRPQYGISIEASFNKLVDIILVQHLDSTTIMNKLIKAALCAYSLYMNKRITSSTNISNTVTKMLN